MVTLDRPKALNAIDPETHDALVQAWQRLRDDPDIRCAVLTGAGERAFCVGIDLKRIDEWYARAPPEERVARWNQEPGLAGLTRNLDPGKPVVAAIQGHCLGGGLELALACDLRIAADNAMFALPELRWGIIPGQGGTQRLPRTVPVGLALEMVLTGKAIDARRAYEVGLVNEVVAANQVLPTALRMAHAIAALPPEAVRRARQAIRQGVEMPLEDGLRLENFLADPLRDSQDARRLRAGFAKSDRAGGDQAVRQA